MTCLNITLVPEFEIFLKFKVKLMYSTGTREKKKVTNS